MSQPQYIPVNPYPQAGEVLEGKYRVEQLLGEGGMGAVAKATHMLRRAPVAIKFMSPAVLALQGAVERFVNEGVAASQIDSDHVVKVFDVGRMPTGAPYLVMEFLDGCDLGQLLAREGGRLEPIRAVHFTLQILRALQTAHASGIIHRDMKPSNCFIINKDGEPDFVKLVDFGISKVRSDDTQAHQANLTRTNSALGTPLYMSPEQARSPRDVDHRADLYSVGAILYELLTGRTPYVAESGEYTEILFKIFTTEPEPLRSLRPEIHEGLAQVVHHALVRDPNQRFSSASEFAEALVPFADERSGQVVQRLRGGRGRSLMPGSQAYVPGQPGGPGTGARGPVTGARGPVTGPQGPMSGVHGSAPGAPMQTNPTPGDALRAPRVPTDVGVTRETPPQVGQPAAKSSRGPLVLAFVAVVVLCAGGGIFVYRSRQAPAPAATRDPMESATVVAPPPPSLLPSTGIPSASLSPLPSVNLAPSASSSPTTTGAPPGQAGNQAAPPGNPNGAPSSKTKPPVPVNLNGVQPHF
jgi:serine/threonine-protein kinase